MLWSVQIRNLKREFHAFFCSTTLYCTISSARDLLRAKFVFAEITKMIPWKAVILVLAGRYSYSVKPPLENQTMVEIGSRYEF